MPRELSQAEKDYIVKNVDNMTPEAMCVDMPGVGPKTVKDFLENGVMPEANRDESAEERTAKVQKAGRAGLTAGKLMGRDPKRGIAVMTPGASEMADAMRTVNVPSNDKSARAQPNRIHVMDPAKRVR
jgi:hypothetical protein